MVVSRGSLATLMVLLSGLATGCGDVGHAAIVRRCLSGGEDKQACTCMADEAKRQLDPKTFEAMALEAKGETEAARSAIVGLGPDQQLEVVSFALSAASKCKLGGE